MDKKAIHIAKQGAILAAASLLVRIIGVLYRIPMTNILGNEGNGYYNNAFNIYTYLLIVSSYGMPTAISRIVSGKLALRQRKEAHLIFKASIWLNILISAFFSAALFYIAAPYANFIHVPGAETAIKCLAPSLVIFAIMSSFRGYFQGMNTMVPTAFSQVIEQVFNAAFSILLPLWLMQKGGAELAAAGGTLGTGIGALMGLFFLLFLYGAYRSRMPKSVRTQSPLTLGELPGLWQTILMTSIPIVIGTATFNISTIIDDMMFSRALFFHNYSHTEIAVLNGILSGKYTLIITMPIAIASALAAASIPSISAAVALSDHKAMLERVNTALKSSVLIAMPASVGVFVLAGPILRLLFKVDEFAQTTTDILRIGAITVLLFSVSTLSVGLLQGLGHVGVPVRSALKAIAIKVAFNFLVFYAFNLNLYGAAYANIVFSAASAYFNLSAVVRLTRVKLPYVELFGRPAVASVLMGGMAFLTYLVADIFLPNGTLGNAVATLLAILVAMVVYFVLIIRLRVVSVEELREMPFGGRLAGMAKRLAG